MAHKGIFTRPPEWWKHLRNYNKRRFNKAERKAAKRQVAPLILKNILK